MLIERFHNLKWKSSLFRQKNTQFFLLKFEVGGICLPSSIKKTFQCIKIVVMQYAYGKKNENSVRIKLILITY